MGVLKFKKGGIEFEYTGDSQEINILINRLAGIDPEAGNIAQRKLVEYEENMKNKVSVPMKLSAEPTYPRAKISAINLPLPNIDEVVAFIKTKPEYRHTLAEVQEHFFGKKFISRGETASMYHRTSRQLVDVRRLIEQQDKGEFKVEILGANVAEFYFVINKVP